MAPKKHLIGEVVLGQYLVEEELGAGAMGSVFRGRHTKLKRPVAIKIMHDHLVGEPMLIERFRREAQAAGKLDHANVVPVLDVGEIDGGRQVMVMEYAAGKPLSASVTTAQTPERTLHVIAQLLRGLDHAHAMGLVHRDLKPDNVIIQIADDGSEIARIVDFGIAVLRSPDDSVEGGRLTASGMIVGTPQYMAPEQAKSERVDQRADLYALGVIMYEMLSGKTPFDGSAMEVALQKIDHDPPPLAARAGITIDRVLEVLLFRLLVRDPEQRVATAHRALELVELYQRDRWAVAAELGVIDVDQALAIVSLPPPPR